MKGFLHMKLIGIDIGKNKHFFCIMDQQTGEIISQSVSFSNDKEGFYFLIQKIKSYSKDSVLIGMEDTGHYHFALLKYLLDLQYTVALINPKTTDFNRKMQGGITKNDKLDTFLKTILIDVFFFFKIMMMSCQLFLFIKIKTVDFSDTILFFTFRSIKYITDIDWHRHWKKQTFLLYHGSTNW